MAAKPVESYFLGWPNPELKLAPFSRWTLRDKAALCR